MTMGRWFIAPGSEFARSVGALYRLMDHRARRMLQALSLLGLVNMMIEIAAVIAVVLLLFTVESGTTGDQAPAAFLSDTFGHWSLEVPTLLVFILVAYLVKNGLRVVEVFGRESVGERLAGRYSKRLFNLYLQVPYERHLRQSANRAIDTIRDTSEDTLSKAVSSLMAVLSDSLITLGIFIVLLQSSPGPVFVLAITIGLTGLLLLWLLHDHFGRIGHQLRIRNVAVLALLRQVFAGFREIRLFQRERYVSELFTHIRDDLTHLRIKEGAYYFLPQIALEMIFIASFVALGWYAFTSVERSLLLPLVGTYAFCGLRLLPSSYRLLTAINRLRALGPVLEFLQEELNRNPPPVTGASEILKRPVAVVLRNVGFSYGNDSIWQMTGVSFEFRPGKSYAIVGESGSGKTTLLNLVAGLLDPSCGSIYINDQSLLEVRLAWQKALGYVAQDSFILDGTIEENLTLGNEPQDQAQLDTALANAQLDDWIKTLPQGRQTSVGDGGIRLSGGQKQRLAVARALYKKPTILLFDEPMANLDTRTQRLMEATLLSLDTAITRIMVTHRLPSARRCDEILYLSGGRLLCHGNYDELNESNESFREFAHGG